MGNKATFLRIILACVAAGIVVAGTASFILAILLPLVENKDVLISIDAFVPSEIILGGLGILFVVIWFTDYIRMIKRIRRFKIP